MIRILGFRVIASASLYLTSIMYAETLVMYGPSGFQSTPFRQHLQGYAPFVGLALAWELESQTLPQCAPCPFLFSFLSTIQLFFVLLLSLLINLLQFHKLQCIRFRHLRHICVCNVHTCCIDTHSTYLLFQCLG